MQSEKTEAQELTTWAFHCHAGIYILLCGGAVMWAASVLICRRKGSMNPCTFTALAVLEVCCENWWNSQMFWTQQDLVTPLGKKGVTPLKWLKLLWWNEGLHTEKRIPSKAKRQWFSARLCLLSRAQSQCAGLAGLMVVFCILAVCLSAKPHPSVTASISVLSTRMDILTTSCCLKRIDIKCN